MLDKSSSHPSSSSEQSIVCLGEELHENKKKVKKGGKVINLISFELGAVGGKLMLTSYLFYAFWIVLRLNGALSTC